MAKRNKLIFLTIIAIAINCGCFAVVSAYFVATDEANNTMTVGHNTISILEEFVPPDSLYPGVVIAKKVNIENTGETPCVVRVSVDYSNKDMEQIAELDIDEEHWVCESDGYYYYNEILDVGDITHPLFNRIMIRETASQADLKDFDVMVHAESMNAEINSNYSDISWKR